MSIDVPHAHGSQTLEDVAKTLSKQDSGETYMLVRPIANNKGVGFVTNDTQLAHSCPELSSIKYFQNGHLVQDGLELLFGAGVN